MEQHGENDIAILGLACRFPGASGEAEFWENLRGGKSSITQFSAEELAEAGIPNSWLASPNFVRAGGTVEGIDRFDAAFFGISPGEAELLDPQHRLFLECAWRALENAAINPFHFSGAIGLFAGAGINTYLLHHLTRTPGFAERADRYRIKHASDKDFLTTRVSYKLDLRGPSIDIQTSCSTSLVAVHLACQSLLNGESDVAMAGGVTLSVPQKSGYFYHEGMIRSPDGQCRAFDASARGTVDGNGLGIVVLKLLEEALRDGDPVRAVIKGSAVNNDGAAKLSFTAPAMDGQAAVIAEALAVSGVSAESVSYVEAHGTATTLGDPIEVAALTQAFRRTTKRRCFCALGSVKTNIGHLDTAAGVAGLIKTVLSMEHRELPPSLHFRKPNPRIDFEASPFFVNASLKAWQADGPLRAGVSSFGVGGTNAHLILEAAPRLPAPESNEGAYLLPLSAKTGSALEAVVANLADFLDARPEVPLASVAATLQSGRAAMEYRDYVVARTTGEAVHGLRALSKSTTNAVGKGTSETTPDFVFLFTGQGAQTSAMGASLYREEPLIREWIDRGLGLLRERFRLDLREIWFPDKDANTKDARLDRTEFAQPALYILEYAMAQWWLARGLKPVAMLGHSIGEYVAASLAGVFSFEDGLALIAERARLMQQLPEGSMLAVALGEDGLAPYLEDGVSLAAVNAPDRTVLAGPHPALAHAQSRLREAGVFCQGLKVSHAFHSEMMAPAIDPFLEALGSVAFQPPKIPFISNLSGGWIQPEEAVDPTYWARHLRGTVRFADGLRLLSEKAGNVLLEIGPGRALAKLAARLESFREGSRAFSSLEDPGGGPRELLETLGALWCAGASPDWSSLYSGGAPRRVALPGYPFERRGFWIKPVGGESPPPETCLIPLWQRSWPPAQAAASNRLWLLLYPKAWGQWIKELKRMLVAMGATVRMEPRPEQSEFEPYFQQIESPPDTLLYVAGEDSEHEAASLRGLVGALAGMRGKRSETFPRRVVLITRSIFDITGSEPMDPHLASIAGYLGWLSDQRPDLVCRHLDWDADRTRPPATEWARALFDELGEDVKETPAAWRHGHRWVLHRQNLELSASEEYSLLNPGAAYLVCDDAGGTALQTAQALAAETGSTWIWLEPGKELSEPRVLSPVLGDHGPLAIPIQELQQRESALAERRGFKTLASFPGLETDLDQLCRAHIYEYFESRGLTTGPGSVYTREEFIQALGIQAPFTKFLDLFLHHLALAACIEGHEGKIRFLMDRGEVGSSASFAEALGRRFPEQSELLEMLRYCVEHYGPALSGEVDAITVLYPEGRSDFMEAASGSMARLGNQAIYLDMLCETIAALIEHRKGRALRILEVGAGNGRLTWRLAPSLQGGPVSYTFSDIGRSFVLRAERHASRMGYGFVDCRVLDIAADPGGQGFEADSFDLILAFNVVHATPCIRETLANLQTLLAPGGRLCLLESVSAPLASNMLWGLAEGWWLFQDRDLRELSPLLPLDRWEGVLREAGYDEVISFPRDPQRREHTDCGLIFAASPLKPVKKEFDPPTPRFFSIRADESDPKQVRGAIELVRREFGPVAGWLYAGCRHGVSLDLEMERVRRWQELLADDRMDFRVFCVPRVEPEAGLEPYRAAAFWDAMAAELGRGGAHALALHIPRREASGVGVDQGASYLLRLLRQRVTPAALLGTGETPMPGEKASGVDEDRVDANPPIQTGRHPRPDLETAYLAPRNEVETRVASIWEELLGIEKIGIHDRFYDLGGDSLLAAQVNARLGRAFALELPAAQLFKEATIAGQAGVVQAVRGSLSSDEAESPSDMIDGEI